MIEHFGLAIFKQGATAFLRSYQMEKAREAAETLRKAMAKGKVYRITDDQAAAALFAYMRAAEEGAARLNLKMIAEAFANAAQEPTFAPDTFRRHTRLLADLSREEIIVVAQLIAAKRTAHGLTTPEARLHITNHLRATLVGPGKCFASDGEIVRHLTALQRSGLVINESVLAGGGTFGGNVYMPTSLLVEIECLVDFEQAANAAAECEPK